jgi:putative thioredoxin
MIDFNKEVIEKSFEQPVVVDFWAEWCGPCKVLGPLMEEIAAEQQALWSLVKIDTQGYQEIALTYNIRSIPNVKMFYRGEVIDEFTGALPKQMILEWLAKSLPDAGVMALDKLLADQKEPSIEALEQLLAAYPDTHEIRIVISQMLLWDSPDRILELLAPIKMGTPMYDKAINLKQVAEFLLLETKDESLLSIKELLRTGSLEEAIKTIIAVLTKNNQLGEGKLTKAAIGIFNTLGLQHPYSKSYRKLFDMVI